MPKVKLNNRSKKAPRSRSRFGPGFSHATMLQDLGKSNSRSQRIAYYLNWCADNFPYQYQPYNEIVKAINDYSRLPRMDGDQVLSIRNSMSSVRNIMLKKYQRTLDQPGGGGVRATVDDEDAAAVAMPKNLKRLRSAKNAVMATYSIIDVAEVKDPRIKDYLNNSVRDIVKVIGSEKFDARLLPPLDPKKKPKK